MTTPTLSAHEHYADDMVRLLHGDSLACARLLEDQTAQTVVTSPPYFGLRDYGAAGQIGAEATVHEYVDSLVAVFHELARVLADDGTVWLNLGDSYSGNVGGPQGKTGQFAGRSVADIRDGRSARASDLPPKNLIGVPWRVALALQADGWILRSDIIWAKPNSMPESATDRPMRSHEYLFLLAKSSSYLYDAEAIAEVYAGGRAASRRARTGAVNKSNSVAQPWSASEDERTNRRTVWSIPTQPFTGAHFATFPPELVRPCVRAGSRPGDTVLDPFSGSGTTGMVANQEGRRYVGFDLNVEYLDLSLRTRFAQPSLGVEVGA